MLLMQPHTLKTMITDAIAVADFLEPVDLLNTVMNGNFVGELRAESSVVSGPKQ